MQTPLVSCVIPVWNGEKYLAEAIQSVLDQSYPKIEVVIVDDGSTDGTPDVIATFEDRVTSMRQEQSGPAAARNTGIAASKGDFIAFLDSDDIWERSKTAFRLIFFFRVRICRCACVRCRTSGARKSPCRKGRIFLTEQTRCQVGSLKA